MPPEVENFIELLKHIADVLSDTQKLFESVKWILLLLLPFLKQLWKIFLSLLNRLWGSFYVRWVILPKFAPRSFPKTVLVYRIATWLSVSYAAYRFVRTIILLVSLLF